jgi:hypothetical protein
MSAKKFIVELDGQERARLSGLISKGKAPAKVILKARTLLRPCENPLRRWRTAGLLHCLRLIGT